MDENNFKRLLQESAAETHRRIDANATETREQFAETREQFAAIAQRFDQVDARFEHMKLHVDIAVEDMRKDIRGVAEGVMTVNEKLDRETADIRAEMRQGFADTQAMLRVSRNDLDRRITKLERAAK